MPFNIPLSLDRDFELQLTRLATEYGEQFEHLNGLHASQLNFSSFIDNFIDKTTADASIDANANASSKDVCSLTNEMSKPALKLFCLNKLYYEMKKAYGKTTADRWLTEEFNGAMYLHDAASASIKPYCARGDTKILTDRGIFQLKDLVGQAIRVLNRYGYWEDAVVHCFGKQALRMIIVERCGVQKQLYFTSNHQWFVRPTKGKSSKLLIVTTDELKPGMKIPHVNGGFKPTIQLSPFGVAHGFFIGDGDKGDHMRANFCGDKVALLPYFTPANVTGTEKEYVTRGIPHYFKDLPPLTENPSYLYGWLAGYFAADGYVDERGRCTIASTKIEILQYVQQLLCVLGLPSSDICFQDRVNNLTGEMGRVYTITLTSHSLPDNFFIRPFHRERMEPWRANLEGTYQRDWIVRAVIDTGTVEDVYCPIVPKSQSFVLEGGILTHNCWAASLERLAREGLFFLDNYKPKPAQHLNSFIGFVREYVATMSTQSSGATGMPDLLAWCFYFWKKDVATGYAVKDPEYHAKQAFQNLIFTLNQKCLRIVEPAFTNISIVDRFYAQDLFGGIVYPDGTMFIDSLEEFITFQKWFMETFTEIKNTEVFAFPVVTYCLLFKDGKFQDEEFARWCSDHNCLFYDANFFQSGETSVLSNCCRLLSDTKKINAFINSIGGSALSVGSVKVNTINLKRIALEIIDIAGCGGHEPYKLSCNDEAIYLEWLRDRVELCCKLLHVQRHTIIRTHEKGLLPMYCEGGFDFAHQYSTIGINSLFETMEAFGYIKVDEFGNHYYTDDADRFAKAILETINEVKDVFTADKDYLINVEQIPGEQAAIKFCQKDNLLYGDDGTFMRGNQWIPLVKQATVAEKIRVCSNLDKLVNGGAILHLNIENRFASTDEAWRTLNYIASQGVFYFAFNPKILQCADHHAFMGTDHCPECGKSVENVYSRTIGYIRPRKAFSEHRRREFDLRRWHKSEEAHKIAEDNM